MSPNFACYEAVEQSSLGHSDSLLHGGVGPHLDEEGTIEGTGRIGADILGQHDTNERTGARALQTKRPGTAELVEFVVLLRRWSVLRASVEF